MIKKQRIFAIVASVLVAALIPLYFFVIAPLTKKQPSTDNTANREIMYTQTERANIKSIEVVNSHGSYKFVYNEDYKDYYIDGHPLALYDESLFSQLVVSCGYTLAMASVENENAEKLADYGLDDSQNPAYYVLTTKEDVSYKVLVGNKIVTGGGYYARMDGQNKVYVLDTSLEATVLSPIENYVTPLVIFPTSSTTYADVKTFEIYRGPYMPEDFNLKTDKEEAQAQAEQDNAENEDGTEKPALSEPIVKFHYVQTQDLGVMSNAIFYMDYPGDGAYNASDFVTKVLQQFVYFQGYKTEVLEPTSEDLEKYSLFGDAEYTLYLINYSYLKGADGKTVKIPVQNRVTFSKLHTDEKTGMQFRYAHSLFFDESAMIYNNLIVKVPEYDCEFLSYDLNTWVDSKLFGTNISSVSDIRVESGKTDISFSLEGEGQSLTVTEPNGHKPQIENFKRFYQTLLIMQKGGFVSLSKEEIATLVADEGNITAKLTVKLKEGKEFVYRFYSLGQQTYYTVNGEGQFYLETKYVTKTVNDAIRVTRDEIVNVDNSY